MKNFHYEIVSSSKEEIKKQILSRTLHWNFVTRVERPNKYEHLTTEADHRNFEGVSSRNISSDTKAGLIEPSYQIINF